MHRRLRSVHITEYEEDRSKLRALFELAEDSTKQLDRYIDEGVVLVAWEADDPVGHLQLVATERADAVEIKNMAVREDRQRRGIGSWLITTAIARARANGVEHIWVATAAADVDNLRFYQRHGFRMSRIDRDAFTPATGYPADQDVDGVELRDRVWLDRPSDDGRSDRDLMSAVADRVAVPRGAVPSAQVSFVLHAPLELLARAVLLPLVSPTARARARARTAGIADRYDAAAPPWSAPDAPAEPGGDQIAVLVDALTARDADAADRVAAGLDRTVSPARLGRGLASSVLPALGAAGHGNIYLALLARSTSARPTRAMLRSVVHQIVTDPAGSIPVPSVTVADDEDGLGVTRLVEVLARAEPVGAPSSTFIAPLVEHAIAHGALEAIAPRGKFTAPSETPHPLLRFAAHAMLQGDPAATPYGWTHCLTLAQGALRTGELADQTALGTYVAMVYLLAHWYAYGVGRIDLQRVPAPSPERLADALTTSPAAAAAAAWHDEDEAATIVQLADAAATNHDAHRVKYTLACIEAAFDDPDAGRLYLAAAAYLNAWWELHGDPDDPWK